MTKIDMPEKSKDVHEMPKQPPFLKKWKTQIIFGSGVIGLLFLIFVPMILMNQHSTNLIDSNSNKLLATMTSLQNEIAFMKGDINGLSRDVHSLNRDVHFLNRDCPSGWKNITGNCYFSPDEMFTFSKAKDFCRGKGARIFEPRDQHVSDMVFAGRSEWHYWIGMYSSSSTWKWLSDNSSVSWNNFLGIASYFSDRYCVHACYGYHGKWWGNSQYACENDHAKVICERMFT